MVVVTSKHVYVYISSLTYLIVICIFCYALDCTPDLLSQVSATYMSSPTEANELFFTATDPEG